MGANAKKQTFRGGDVKIRLTLGGRVQDIIEAEDIEWHPNLKVVEAEPLSLGRTTRDTFIDGITVSIKGVRKGNGFLKEILRQIDRSVSEGKSFEKYGAIIDYYDRSDGSKQNVKVAEADLTELDPIASGKNFDAQKEGFRLIGQKV